MMIAEKIQRNVDALRKLLAPQRVNLPPLVLPLLDGLEAEAERVAGLEGAAILNFEDTVTRCEGEHEQTCKSGN